MAGANPIAPKERRCIDAVKKVYAVSDAVYAVANEDIIGEDRETILNLLTEARNLALDCNCMELVEEADQLRIRVAGISNVDDIRPTAVKDLKQVAKRCLESLGQARPPP